MKTYYKLRQETEPTAIALGYFDGVHIGHEQVIMKAVSYKEVGLKPIVLTFQISPRCVLSGGSEKRLMTLKEKVKIFYSMGVEAAYIIDFALVKDMCAEDFVRNVLSTTLNVRQAVCGFNYTFGVGGNSNAKDLYDLGYANNINVDIIKPVKYKGEAVSSTRIRKAILTNELYDIRKMTKNL